MSKGPDEARVAALYQKITGKPMIRGRWDLATQNLAQKIAYVEDACRDVLSAIEDLEKATDRSEISTVVDALEKLFRFLKQLN